MERIMVFRLFSLDMLIPPRPRTLLRALSLTLLMPLAGQTIAKGQDAVSPAPKQIIGATDTFTEASTGIPFSARIDTGAKSCSLHVEQMEIKDEAPKRLANIGKTVRFLIQGKNGKSEWIETTIAGAVRVKSSVFKNGEFDRRYKVRLTLRWNEFEKEVLVTLNDRTDMEYPLLIGRNYLRGDFLVDVAKKAGE
ncbi:MAG TPA: RimK/LysX family protein [Lacipirellulaceae bacterium]